MSKGDRQFGKSARTMVAIDDCATDIKQTNLDPRWHIPDLLDKAKCGYSMAMIYASWGVTDAIISNWRRQCQEFDYACEFAKVVIRAALDNLAVQNFTNTKFNTNLYKFYRECQFGANDNFTLSKNDELAGIIDKRGSLSDLIDSLLKAAAWGNYSAEELRAMCDLVQTKAGAVLNTETEQKLKQLEDFAAKYEANL